MIPQQPVRTSAGVRFGQTFFIAPCLALIRLCSWIPCRINLELDQALRLAEIHHLHVETPYCPCLTQSHSPGVLMGLGEEAVSKDKMAMSGQTALGETCMDSLL